MKPAFPLLRALLGREYERFEKEMLIGELGKIQKIKRETLEKITLALSKGEIPITEELLSHQTRTARNGGAFVEATMHLPDLTPKTFVKVFSSQKDFDIEARVTAALSEAGSPYVLPPRFIARPKWYEVFKSPSLFATPFVEGERIYDLYRKEGAQKEKLLEECLDALLDTYERMAGKLADKPTRLSDAAERAIERITGKKVSLKEEYEEIEKKLEKAPRVFLHGDPNLSNFVKGERLHLVDWEFARTGIMHSDLYRLLLRADIDEEIKQKLLRKAHEFAKEKLDYKGSWEDFKEEYRTIEMHENLITAAQFRHLSRTNPVFEQAANLYFTRAVREARGSDLAKLLEDTEKIDHQVKVLNDEEYKQAEKTTAEYGPSTIFARSIDGETARKNILETIELKRKTRKAGKLTALTMMALLAVSAGRLMPSAVQKEPQQIQAYTSLEDYLEYKMPDTVFEKEHPELFGIKPDIDFFAWMFAKIDTELKMPFEEYEKLQYGKLVQDPGRVTKYPDGKSIADKLAEKYGLPKHLLNALFHTNAVHAEDRDSVSGLPITVLNSLAENDKQRSLEERADLAVRHLRKLLERTKYDVPKSIALYYCGEDALEKARSAEFKQRIEKDKKAPYPIELWEYIHQLPEPLLRLTMQGYTNVRKFYNDNQSEFGYISEAYVKDMKVNDAYPKTSTAQQK